MNVKGFVADCWPVLPWCIGTGLSVLIHEQSGYLMASALLLPVVYRVRRKIRPPQS